MTRPVRIRAEAHSDQGSIRMVHASAFGQDAEADLVDILRGDGDLVLSLVAITRTVIGHVAFSRLVMLDASLRATALAPLSVLPAHQGGGVGTALVRQGLQRLADAGEDLVIVLGEPGYYARFGFTADAVRDLRTPYDGPYLQGLFLSDKHHAGGIVRYARAFSKIG